MGVDYREQYKAEHLEPFFPNEIVKMIIVVLCTLALLTFLAVLPVSLEHVGIEGFAHEQEPADPGINELFVRQPLQGGDLPAARRGAARRHVGRLVPVEQRRRRIQIVNFRQKFFKFPEFGVHRAKPVSPGGVSPDR